MADPALQNFIIARLADYCDYRSGYRSEMQRDPLSYLWSKLGEIEEPIVQLKQQLLRDAVNAFFSKLNRKGLTETEFADFKQLLDAYLDSGDYADAAFHLDPRWLADEQRRNTAEDFMANLRAHALLNEESKPEEEMNKNWRRVVAEIYRRLDFGILEAVVKRRPLNARRLRFILRRCRMNTAEFCAVFHCPISPTDTFSPFMLPRVEAIIAANRRLLRVLRTG